MVTIKEIIHSFTRGVSHSKVSLLGAVMTTVTFPVLVVSAIFDLQGMVDNPYFGFIVYMVLGPMFILGLVLVFLGVFFLKGKEEIELFTFEYLKEQFTAPTRFARIRKIILLVSFLTVLNIIIVGLVSYNGYHYTESVSFCGQFCHSVMQPEFTAYQNSPHSRVACVECHIGSGAQWFAKSKISGVRQLFAVAFNTYSRPIETPVHGLRPARETCEECHRPEVFHGDKLYVKDKFLEDENNTHVQTVLLMKVGSGGHLGEEAQGIHWHVAPENKIVYTHTDRARENISEVTLITPEAATTYVDADPAEASQSEEGPMERVMDCIDCHNRPTHIYLSPEDALDQKMLTKKIPTGLPYVKRQAMEAVTKEYSSLEEAKEGIAASLESWYTENYPAIVKEQPDLLWQAVEGAQQAYAENVFPEMRIGWNTYQSFLGHRDESGCFRCHDESHETAAGKVISMDCDTCHIILAEEEPQPQILQMLKGS